MSNPHIEAATKLIAASESATYLAQQNTLVAIADTQATLAPAYEAQTANLLALWANPSSTVNGPHGEVTWGIDDDLIGKLLEQIQQRLGGEA